MRLSVALGLWLDRPAREVMTTAEIADDAGYDELWVGEMATYDAMALGTAVAGVTRRIPLCLGPLAVAVRSPVGIAMGAASVADLTGRPVAVALGTSSPTVVGQWHGRSPARAAQTLRESARACRELMAGRRAEFEGQVLRTSGFRLRLDPPGGPLTIAAFGPRAVQVAAEEGERMVANLVTVDALAELAEARTVAAAEAGRAPVALAVWVPIAIDPTPDAYAQLRAALVAYLGAPGYAQLFAAAGFEHPVALAAAGAHPRELLAAVPDTMVEAVGAVGDLAGVVARLEAYAAAGAQEVVLVPSATDDDPAGEHTLRVLAEHRASVTAGT